MRIFFLSTSMGMGGADSQLLSRGPGAARPRPRGAHRLAHAARARWACRRGAAGIRDRVAGDARAVSRILGACCDWPAWCGRGGRTWCTATWSTPTSWRGRSGSWRRCRRWSPPSTTSMRAARADGRLSADQRPGRPHDDRQPGGGRPLRRASASSRASCSRSFPTASIPSRFGPCRRGAGESLRRVLGVEPGVRLAGGGPLRGRPRTIPTCCGRSPGCAGASRDAVLLLVGRGSLQAETEALARELGLEDAVRFLGVRDDVPQRHERGGRLRDVLGVGGHADGAAGGGGRGAADRRHGRRREPRGRARRARPGSWCRPATMPALGDGHGAARRACPTPSAARWAGGDGSTSAPTTGSPA